VLPRAADRSKAHLLPTPSIPMCTGGWEMQDPLYRAAARSVVHTLAGCSGRPGVQERAATPFRSPNTPCCLLYVWPWSPARLAILSPHVSLPTCTKIGFLCSVSLILTPTSQQERASRRRAAGNADAANTSVNLSLFLELTSRARGYGKSWVHFAPFMGCKCRWCNAQLSRR
jgi:hypothetical protein